MLDEEDWWIQMRLNLLVYVVDFARKKVGRHALHVRMRVQR
jgi:hypothetical protein